MEYYKLCYIDRNKAWFTNNFEEQWGDDWNDRPYKHNAGEPYDHWSELIEDNEDIIRRKYKHHEITHAYIESYGLLQVDWNDEIVADFVANYMIDIFKTIDEITSKLRRAVINYETNKKKNNKHNF